MNPETKYSFYIGDLVTSFEQGLMFHFCRYTTMEVFIEEIMEEPMVVEMNLNFSLAQSLN